MNVDGAGFDIDVGAPHGIEQLLAGEDAAGVLHQLVEEPVLCWPEMNVAIAASDAVGAAVNRDLADSDYVFDEAWPHTAHYCTHTGQQLAHRKRLDDVVVGTG